MVQTNVRRNMADLKHIKCSLVVDTQSDKLQQSKLYNL